MKELLILATGGTIDSEWDATRDTAVPMEKSFIKEYIEKYIRPNYKITTKVVTMRDSREIDNSVRQTLLGDIKSATADHILIPHGTYTMAETARFICEHLGKTDKRIMFTGSFYPIVGFSLTDATFNLGYAIASLEHLDGGVYVAMNGRVFDPNSVTKDVQNGLFTTK